MLFDLRSSGRRRTVKVVYITLAFLMGGGLVFFGIGGGGGINGGLFDAFNGNSGGTSVDERSKQREAALVAKVRANPKDAAAYADLARVRVQIAGQQYDQTTNQYSDAGKAQLRAASAAWQRHLALAGSKPDPLVASVMVQAYASLNDIPNAVAAQEIVAEDRNSVGAYSTLAQLAWQAGQTRKGDLAAKKAIALAPKDERASVKSQLDSAKQQATSGSSSSG